MTYLTVLEGSDLWPQLFLLVPMYYMETMELFGDKS